MSVLHYIPGEFWILLHFSLAAWAVYHNLLYKRDSRSALGWIMISLLVPYGGPIGYYLFGINRIHKRAQGIKRGFLSVDYEMSDRAPIATGDTRPRGIKMPGSVVLGSPMITGNEIRPLHNGDEAYPEMLAAIVNAKHSICLTTYIFQIDKVGQQFVDALEDAIKRNIEVHVIVDGVGELYSLKRSSAILRRLGIRVARFLPPKLFPPSIYINLRNHRKLLVVDNMLGFIGGMNIGDQNTAVGQTARAITDIHFEVKGPIVNQLEKLFLRDWQYATGEDSPIKTQEPSSLIADMECRLIPDGPNEHLDALATVLQAVISAASQSILIMTPYFLPSRELLSAIQSACLRGVDVKILLPGENNLFYMHWANCNTLAELLTWGINIAYQPAPFCHSKMICIDSNYTLIGSANLDSRSLRLNFELGLEVISEELNSELSEHFMSVYSQSRVLKIDEIINRSIPVRLRDSAVALLSPYL